MTKFTITALFATSLLICPCVSGGEIQLCGWKLIDALSMVCEGIYQGPPNMKRDVFHQMAANFPSWLPAIDTRDSQASSHLPVYPRSRQQRGIVDECCRNACTVAVLMSYCG